MQCRLQHQLQLYLLQQHVESTVAAPLLPAPTMGNSAGNVESVPDLKMLAQTRLAHAFLCKGAERGLCTITQEHMQ